MRIVSLVPSHTESLFELGVGDLLVGRTRFCIFPAAAHKLPHVGGTKDADLEKILALAPDLVLADKDENPLALVKSLEAAGVEVLWSDIATVADVAAWLHQLVKRLADARADALLPAFLPHVAEPTEDPIPVFCPIWHPWMTFDGSAYPSAMLAAAGFRNVFEDHAGDRYFENTLEEATAAGAQFVLLPTEPFPFHKKTRNTAPLPSRIIDGEALTWFGTRTKRGMEELKESAHLVRLELALARQQG